MRTGSGPPTHPENHKSIGFLSNTGPDPLTNHKATKPAFNVGPIDLKPIHDEPFQVSETQVHCLINIHLSIGKTAEPGFIFLKTLDLHQLASNRIKHLESCRLMGSYEGCLKILNLV